MSDQQHGVTTVIRSDELTGEWSVWRRAADGTPEMIKGDLPEEIARRMVADYTAEGETVWTAPAPESHTHALSAE